MIHVKKAAAVLSVVLCGPLTMSVRAQEPEEPRPRPVPGARQEKPKPAPSDEAAEELPPPAMAPAPSGRSPVTPPPTGFTTGGLSPEAIRSFQEFPPSIAPEEAEMLEDAPAARASAAQPSSRPSPARNQQRPEYVVEPPDLVLVEVLETLPGRPISGERLVRPDGRISLGFYGEIPVAGLTLAQIKERIVLHLRKFINDAVLGLVEIDENGEIKRDAYGRVILRDPKDTDRVFVDVTAYNSKHCYVLGDVVVPGILPYTGGDTVLDMIQYAGGLLPSADKARIRLIRSFPKGSPAQVLPVNYDDIAMGTDSSTNYAMMPYDRLVIPGALSSLSAADAGRGASTGTGSRYDARAARASASQSAPGLYFNRKEPTSFERPDAELEQRIDALEKKLDQLIEIVGNTQPQPAGRPEPAPAPRMGPRHPLQDELERPGSTEPTPMRGMTVPTLRPDGQPQGPRRPGPNVPRPRQPGAPRTTTASPAESPESQSGAPLPPDAVPEP